MDRQEQKNSGNGFHAILDIDGWHFDSATHVLQKGDERVRLEPKTSQLLSFMASHCDDVLSRERLFEEVWPGVLVSDEVLTNAINKLRRAFKDDRKHPRIIETIPKTGYRFIAQVEEFTSDIASQDIRENTKVSLSEREISPKLPDLRSVGWVVLVILLVSIITGGLIVFNQDQETQNQKDNPSIAVLPFANLSDDAGQEYFSDGLTEDLLTDLSKVSALTVISRSSSFAYRDNNPDIRNIGKELGVSHVIEGSVRKAGNRVRISAQLVDAVNGQTVWAERYDRKLEDIFSLQDEVRGNIVSALKIKLDVSEVQRISRRGTNFIEAYDLLMQGRYKESSFSRVENSEAIRIYQRVLEIDPNYSMAYARLANMLEIRSRNGWSENTDTDINNAIRFAEKAMTLEPDNPFAHWTHGRIILRIKSGGIKNLFSAATSLEKAIELDPNYADAYGSISLFFLGVGKSDEALSAIEKAMLLNPQYPFWYIRNRGLIYYMKGDYDSAILDLEKAIEINPTTHIGRWWLAAAYAQINLNDEADWQIEELSMLGFESTIKEQLNKSIIHYQPYVDKLAEGLRKAGLPEQ